MDEGPGNPPQQSTRHPERNPLAINDLHSPGGSAFCYHAHSAPEGTRPVQVVGSLG